MNKVKDFQILFDNDGVFSAGKCVTGRFAIDLRGSLEMSGIKTHLRGLAKVHWTVRRGSGQDTDHEHYRAEVLYVDTRQVIGGRGEHGDTNPTLPPGHHEVPFAFRLPPGCPTSHETKTGKIRYSLEAEIERQWRFNEKTIRSFTVIHPVDVNTGPLLVPQCFTREKTVYLFPFSSRKIGMSVRTDRKGYCPGESITISAEIQNLSSRRVKPVATLYRRSICYAESTAMFKFSRNTKSKSETLAVASVHGNWIGGERTESWTGLLEIPRITPSISNCSIIVLEYYLSVKLRISYSSSLCSHIGVVIGTVRSREPARRSAVAPSAVDVAASWGSFQSDPALGAPPGYDTMFAFDGTGHRDGFYDQGKTGGGNSSTMLNYSSIHDFGLSQPS